MVEHYLQFSTLFLPQYIQSDLQTHALAGNEGTVIDALVWTGGGQLDSAVHSNGTAINREENFVSVQPVTIAIFVVVILAIPLAVTSLAPRDSTHNTYPTFQVQLHEAEMSSQCL